MSHLIRFDKARLLYHYHEFTVTVLDSDGVNYLLEHSNELGPLRKKQFPEKLPTFKPKVPLSSTIHKHEGAWCLPIAITDLLVVYRTQRWFYENDHKRPVQFRPYFKLGGFMTTIAIALVCIIGFLMSKISVTKRLLLNYPSSSAGMAHLVIELVVNQPIHVELQARVIEDWSVQIKTLIHRLFFSFGMMSHQGPTENVLNNTTVLFQLFGEGWERGADVDTTKPNKKAIVTSCGHRWMQEASCRSLWRSKGEAFVQQWTSWADDDDDFKEYTC
ncbi:hypothetical protein MSG28_007858 [Choristoneura fumiferana]|uniref:Uncharacterized protein n=1 Tax=Choristoneura fumiferana TaxID=7141 RepID=A0ACC0J9C1_CHOFU|nr:hypothetical protein MSG28_007858 [Choristoneura fumiferana]